MRRFLHDNGLWLFFGGMFVLALVGQAVAGFADHNHQQIADGAAATTLGEYLVSSDFATDVAENWQSEYLQFFLFTLATIWLVQRGSPDSKKPGDEGVGSDEEQKVGQFADDQSPPWASIGGFRQTLYSNSLLLVMGAIFLLSWFAQSLAGTAVMNEENSDHGQPPITWAEYVVSPDFWNRTLQNWQSEFLAMGSIIALSIFLRQRGSSQSKPVGAPHHATADSGE